MLSGPLFRQLEKPGHIFDLNEVWEKLYDCLRVSAANSSDLLGKTFFSDDLLTQNEVYDELFKETNDITLDTLTRECLEIIYCT